MPTKEEARQKMIASGFPAELIDPMARLFKMRQQITVRVLPREAWALVGLLQFASRNPAIGDDHRELIRYFGDALAEGIVNIDPIFEKYLAMGWDPTQDVPKDGPIK